MDNELDSKLLFFRCLQEIYGLDPKREMVSAINYEAIQNIYDELLKYRDVADKYEQENKKTRIKQSKFVGIMLKDPLFIGKSDQKDLLRALRSGKKIEFKKIRQKIPKKIGQSDNQWRNCLSQLKGRLEDTLKGGNEYFNFKIETSKTYRIRYNLVYYQLTIIAKDKLPFVIK